ncbi:CDP-alcohol phosphatidyltransferase [Alkalitalea saponilacus]|uniref:DUF4395 domain-containing protein n=1 Tax=Alkalitalea saponilacus TaxID=889453 RepID=UPI000B4BF133|nr:DUF4395 domain-containing protein [Alkalitalea saponilacus]ASB50254.1 CDP-alcohol phosphatidyltransferase [Alkalitalea saponilacus]
MKIETLCPVSKKMINKWVPRMSAVITTLLMLLYLYTQNYFIVFFLAVDFAFRGFDKSEFSPIAWIAKSLVKVLPFKKKEENAGPKFFAARIGWVFTIAILLLTAFNLTTAAIVLGGVLTFFAFLEASIGFCTACYVYPHLLRMWGMTPGGKPQEGSYFKQMEL